MSWFSGSTGGAVAKLEKVCREAGDVKQLKQLLGGRKLDLSTLVFDDGWTPLHVCSSKGFKDCIEVLLASGASTGERLPGDGTTPLMLAAFAGLDDVVEVLLDAGASLVDTDVRGFNALHYAASGGKTTTCSRMLDRGADVTIKNREGYSAMLLAACGGHTETVAYMLSNTASSIAETEKKGNTALHMACAGGYVRLVDFLMQAGANELALNFKGKKPLDLCRPANKPDVSTIINNNISKRNLAAQYDGGSTPESPQQQQLQVIRGGVDTNGVTLYPNAADITVEATKQMRALASTAGLRMSESAAAASKNTADVLMGAGKNTADALVGGMRLLGKGMGVVREPVRLEDIMENGYAAEDGEDGGGEGAESESDESDGESAGTSRSGSSTTGSARQFVTRSNPSPSGSETGSSVSGASGWDSRSDGASMSRGKRAFVRSRLGAAAAPASAPEPETEEQLQQRMLDAGWGKASSGKRFSSGAPPLPRSRSRDRLGLAVPAPPVIVDQISEIYKVCIPKKLPELDRVLAEYSGREDELLVSLRLKYKEQMAAYEARKEAMLEEASRPPVVLDWLGQGLGAIGGALSAVTAGSKPDNPKPNPNPARAQIAKSKVEEIYLLVNPAKTKDLPQIFTEWAGREEELLQNVKTKYKQELANISAPTLQVHQPSLPPPPPPPPAQPAAPPPPASVSVSVPAIA
jgi:ankyrin repeat protein